MEQGPLGCRSIDVVQPRRVTNLRMEPTFWAWPPKITLKLIRSAFVARVQFATPDTCPGLAFGLRDLAAPRHDLELRIFIYQQDGESNHVGER